MREYMLSNAVIILGLLRAGHTYRCDRCQKGMHVKYASGLCVECFNARPRLSARVEKRTRELPERASLPRPAAPAPAV